jgi:two-component system, NarL family, sensor kinase
MISPLPNTLRIYSLFLGLLFLCQYPGVSAQNTKSGESLDSLIVRLPAMMRSDENIARKMIDELLERSVEEQHRHGIIQSLFFKAWYSYRHDPADVALRSIDSALQHVEGIHSDTALVNFYILKGQCYVKKTQFGKALESFNEAIKVADKRNDQATRISTLISIGWAYMEDGKPAEAIRFFNEVLRLNPAEDYPFKAVLLCNIAACYNTMGNFRLAEFYALKGIAAARSRQSVADLANGLNILARSYYRQGKMEKAIAFLKEAAVVREKIADPSMLASDYLELADLYSKNGQPSQAIAWAKKAEALSAQQANSLKLTAAYQSLSSAYETVGDHKNAFLYLKKLLAHKDSVADAQYNEAFAQMQVQFETQKKTAENLQLKKENLEARLQNSYQQRWLLALAAGLVLLIASGIYISKLMKSRYKTRLALAQLKEQKKRTLAVMETEEKERRRIAGDLHDGVGQTLAAASLQLAKARKGQLSLDKVDELISQACTEVRTLSHQVTPELLLHHGLVKALEQAVDRLNDANDRTVFNLFTHIEEPLDDDMASLTLYRCFQELCTNTIKHAGASEVTVQLNLTHEEAELMVEDNGVGFRVEDAAYGLGLKNMESRLAVFDGELLVDSTPGKGTTITVRLQHPLLNQHTIKTV